MTRNGLRASGFLAVFDGVGEVSDKSDSSAASLENVKLNACFKFQKYGPFLKNTYVSMHMHRVK